jgi:hypothetical protein
MPAKRLTHPIPVIVTTLSEELTVCCEAFDCAVYCILPSLPPSYAK